MADGDLPGVPHEHRQADDDQRVVRRHRELREKIVLPGEHDRKLEGDHDGDKDAGRDVLSYVHR